LRREACDQPWLNLVINHSGSCKSARNNFIENLKKSGTDCPNFCSRIYKPVCGTDNKTHANECTLKRKSCEEPSLNLKIKTLGECESENAENITLQNSEPDCPLFCHRMLRPVCGSDNETYGNECLLRQQACKNPSINLHIKFAGACKSENQDDTDEPPLAPEVSLKSVKSDCPRFCNRMRRPVCGSNNQTYANECVLRMHSCNNPSLELFQKRLGEC